MINALSLFDGISCGQIALQRAGVQVGKYFASEIDKNAIKVTQENWPNTIQLGSVLDVKGADLPKIDLLMGGFCCQSFSFAGKRLNFEDPRGKLFFECVRLMEECKPRFFLFENVKMKKEHQDVISGLLGVEPISINSSRVSAQNRNRLYWTNIPSICQPEDKGILFKDIIEGPTSDEIYKSGGNSKKLKHYIGENFSPDLERVEENLREILKTSKYKDSFKWKFDTLGRVLVMRPDNLKIQRVGRVANAKTKTEIITCLTQPYIDNGFCIRKITPIEAERLQTVPDNYTSCLSENQRYHALGNGWTVDVIAHIFNSLPEKFKSC